jgi:dihydrofolate synthase/folylpolyglutamate synthase
MNYKEALEYIHGTRKFGCKLGLENIKTLLGMLENPHEKLKYVHVAGTNGKGSTVAFISNILIESGYRTGVFISPYIERFTERIRVNREEIPREDLARITEVVKEKVDEMLNKGLFHPTEFEIVTAIAFQYYYEMKCDIVVLEVGLGGRFDSTNVINTPLVSVITSVSYDHMNILGNTLSQIAFEKAGIIKNNSDVILYPQEIEVEKVIESACNQRNSSLHKVKFSDIQPIDYSIEGQTFNYGLHENLKIKLLGGHQLKNAVVALETCKLLNLKGLKITDETIRKGLEETNWPGRMEVICKNPLVLIDGAHNIDGVKVLAENISTYFSSKKKIFIIGVLKDKEYKAMIEVIAPVADKIITVTPLSERALSAVELADIIKPYCKDVLVSDTIENGIMTAIQIYSNDGIICAFGSLYYIGEVRRYFENLRPDNISNIP